jgi:hypothetical protein
MKRSGRSLGVEDLHPIAGGSGHPCPLLAVGRGIGGEKDIGRLVPGGERWFITQIRPAFSWRTVTGSSPTSTSKVRAGSPWLDRVKTETRLSGVLTAKSCEPSAERASG